MSKTLEALSKDVARVASAARPSLFQISGGRRSLATGISWDGSGLVVAASHTLERDEGLELITEDDETAEATLVGRDPAADVALLRADLNRPAPEWESTGKLTAGQLGVVAAPTRCALVTLRSVDDEWVAPGGGRLDRYIETDPKRFRTFSGSLLIDSAGKAVGMNTTGLVRRTPLAVPTETLRRIVDHLVEHGSVRRGFLGVTTSPVRLPDSVSSQRVGLLVLSVQKGSPASDAGLFLGDVLLGVNGERIETPRSLMATLTTTAVDSAVDLRILRTGEERTVPVQLRARA